MCGSPKCSGHEYATDEVLVRSRGACAARCPIHRTAHVGFGHNKTPDLHRGQDTLVRVDSAAVFSNDSVEFVQDLLSHRVVDAYVESNRDDRHVWQLDALHLRTR